MSKEIKIGSVSIPLDSYVISGTALLGTKGAGKTYAAKGIAEQLLDHDIPIVVFDPIGRWRFMKIAGEDSKRPRGYKIVVAGGEQPDLPLTAQSAQAIVRAAIRENIPLVLDLYDRKLSKADWRRIVQSCFRTLLYENKGIRHVFLEETAEFAPQKIQDGETYAEVEKLVRMGGNALLGITLINQRAQEVNKAVLDLCDNLVLMKQRGSHAIDALEKWIDKLDPDSAKMIARAMPRMTAGEAWVFTGSADASTHVHTDPIRSFHPDRTKPQLTAAAAAARSADPAEFVTKLSGELDQLLKEAEANDPKRLRARIADLERQATKGAPAPAPGKAASREELKAAEDRGYRRGADQERKTIVAALHRWQKSLKGQIHQALELALREIALPDELGKDPGNYPVTSRKEPASAAPPAPRATPALRSSGNGDMPPELAGLGKRVLDALAWLAAKGIEPAPRATVAAVAHVKPSGGYYARVVGNLKTSGYVEYPGDGTIALTDSGRSYADAGDGSGEVHEQWLEILTGLERKLIEVLIERHGESLTREQLAQAAAVDEAGGYFSRVVGHLKTLGAIDYPQKGHVALTRHVMPDG